MAYSQVEIQRTATILGSGLLRAGVRAGDRIGNLFYAGDCYGSFLLHILSVAALPIPVVQVPIGGSTETAVIEHLVDQCGVTVLLSTVTTLCKLADQRLANGNRFEAIHLVLFAGEPLFSDQVDRLRAAFPNSRFRSCIYGSIDAGVVAESVDDHDTRLHQVIPGVHAEICPPSDAQMVGTDQEGVEGSLIVSNTMRTLTPVIRYPTGDRAVWVDYGSRIFRLLGRDSHAVRLGPVSLDFTDLRRIIVEALAGLSVLAVQAVILRADAKDLLLCRVDSKPEDEEAAVHQVRTALHRDRPMFAEHVSRSLIADLQVNFTRISDMDTNDSTGKLLEIVDHRH